MAQYQNKHHLNRPVSLLKEFIKNRVNSEFAPANDPGNKVVTTEG